MRIHSIAVLLSLLTAGCANLGDVIAAKDRGTAQVYSASPDQAWSIAKTVFRWEDCDAVEEHRDQGYMLTTSSMNLISWGAVMGAWIEPAGADSSKVTVVTKRRMAMNLFTTLRESTFHHRFAQALEIIKRGEPLPPVAPRVRHDTDVNGQGNQAPRGQPQAP